MEPNLQESEFEFIHHSPDERVLNVTIVPPFESPLLGVTIILEGNDLNVNDG
jgi:hypothetical protein